MITRLLSISILSTSIACLAGCGGSDTASTGAAAPAPAPRSAPAPAPAPEEAHFGSAYNLIWPNHAGDRSGNKGWSYRGSIRGAAWAYRSLAQSAYITPDNHLLKAYFNDKLSSNLKRDIELYMSPGGSDKTNLGTMRSYDGNLEYRFFEYFMSWVVQYLVDLGFNEAVPFRDYKVKFPIGIMDADAANGYCFQAASLYLWKVGPSQTEYYPDFKTMFKANVPGYTNPRSAAVRR